MTEAASAVVDAVVVDVVVDVVAVEIADYFFCWTRGRSAVPPVSGCKTRIWIRAAEHTQPKNYNKTGHKKFSSILPYNLAGLPSQLN